MSCRSRSLVGLFSLALIPGVRENTAALWSVLGAAGALALWYIGLLLTRDALSFEVALYKQHYIQACVQGSVLAYWGWYWPDVYTFAPFLLAQLFFAFAFQMLLSWSRAEKYPSGFGAFPIVISINLFLWFKPDWFYLQFVLVALGLLAKEFLTWERDGRRRHIFNPSSFPLAILSVILLATGANDITRGQEIAVTQFYPPNMFVFLPGRTARTISVRRHDDGDVGSALDHPLRLGVFRCNRRVLFLRLLHSDLGLPRDASPVHGSRDLPRSELGRIVYGTLYGLSAVGLYYVLGMRGLPTFYDKLLQVPILNLSAKAIDRLAESVSIPKLAPSHGTQTPPGVHRDLGHRIFFSSNATNVLGDHHPGQFIPSGNKPATMAALTLVPTLQISSRASATRVRLGPAMKPD